MTTREQPRADAVRNRERILAAAAAVFLERPGAGMDEVVAASGLARATVYRYFPNREDLVHMVVEQALAEVGDLLADARADEGDVVDALGRLTEAGWQAGADNLALVALVSDGHVPGISGAASSRVESIVENLIERGREEGVLRLDVPASWLVELWFATQQAALMHPPEGDTEPVHLIVSLFLRGAANN